MIVMRRGVATTGTGGDMQPNTPHTVLVATRALLSAPARWTKGEAARDATGAPTRRHDLAVRWCLLGAIERCAGFETALYCQAVDALRPFLGGGEASISLWNDWPSVTHADMLALLDKAIAQGGQSCCG